MADDIDIEEHDILNDPQVSNVYLEFPKIKSEPVEYDDYEEYSGNDYDERYPDQKDNENTAFFLTAPETIRIQQPTVAQNLQSNRIILGNKPCPKYPRYKPGPLSRKLKKLNILLEDWGERLKRSPCYCKVCKTLFATRNAIDAHNMATHSFLVPVEASPQHASFDSVESPPPREDSSKPNHKFCTHCNKYFEDENLLIQHLYDLIQANQKSKEKPKQAEAKPIANAIENVNTTYLCCVKCNSYFLSKSYFDRHCLESHGPCEFSKIKIDGKFHCKFCDSVHSTPLAHNRHVREKHKVISSKVPSKSKFKCPHCKLTFSDINAAKIHQRKHLKKSNKLIIGSNTKHLSYVIFKNCPPIPKNLLFKCKICPTHFVSCTAVINHLNNCSVGSWKCPDCKRIFRYKDKKLHKLQHKHTKEFKVFVAHEYIYARVLYHCAACDIYFEERAFIKHSKNGCGPTSEVKYCATCNMNVNNYTVHKRRHVKRSFIKSDFILINDFIQSKTDNFPINLSKSSLNNDTPKLIPHKQIIGSKSLKRPSDQIIQVPQKKPKLSEANEKVSIYYCSDCRTCFSTLNLSLTSFHEEKKCLHVRRHFICPICGLHFCSYKPMDRHRLQHNTNYNLKNFIFICFKTMKRCYPPIPDFYYCKKCGTHYFSYHQCAKTDLVTCNICKKTFSDKAYRIHIQHHKYFGQPSSSNIEDTLKMKYEMLKPIWNILYNCETCDVTTDSYDDVVDHCQKHFNDLQSFDVVIKKCPQCSLNFEVKCLKKHMQLHSNQEININSFTILKYDFMKLLTDDWLNLFKTLPKEQMMQILRCSIYVTRLVKMTLLQSGPPEFTIYKCQKCEEVVASDELSEHAEAGSCKKRSPMHKCTCGLVFSSKRAKNAHSSFHKDKSMTVNSFRIVAFNHPDDSEFNAILRSENLMSEPNSNTAIMGSKQSESDIRDCPQQKRRGKKYIVYYKCERCYCCTSKLSIAKQHKCPPKNKTVLCNKCNHVFYVSGIVLHRQSHLRRVITANDILVRPYNVDHPSKRLPLSECQKCKIKIPTHLFHTHGCLKKSGKIASAVPSVTLYRCTKCSALFSLKQNYEKHNLTCQVHINTVNNLQTVTRGKQQIYKCKTCSRFILTKGGSQRHVLEKCKRNIPGKICKFCGWKFSHQTLARHQLLHHKTANLKPQDFHIIFVNQNEKGKVIFENEETDIDDDTEDEDTPQNITKKKEVNHDAEVKKSVHVLSNRGNQNNIKPIAVMNAVSTVPDNVSDVQKPVLKTYSREFTNIVPKSVLRSYSRRDRLMERNMRKDMTRDTSDIDCGNEKESKIEEKKSENKFEGQSSYTVKDVIFRCAKCDLHYLNYTTFVNHIQANHRVVRGTETCDTCGLRFTTFSLKRHVVLHSRIANGSIEIKTPSDSVIAKITETIKPSVQPTFSKISDNSGTLNDSVVSQSSSDKEQLKAEDSCLNQTQLDETPKETPPQPEKSHYNETPKETPPQPKKSHNNETPKETPLQPKKSPTAKYYTHKIYKCGQCNVYFMSQNTCYTHIMHHSPIDPKDYIDCKWCSLPFKIMALPSHIKKHHSGSFNLNEVLVEEYTSDSGKTPLIEIYYAIDKVQSRLVSTTCGEMDVDEQPSSSNAEINEESVESSRNDSNIANNYVQPTVEETGTKAMNVTASGTSEDKHADKTDNVAKEANLTNLKEEAPGNSGINDKQASSDDIISKATETPIENNKEELNEHKCRFCGEKFRSNTSKKIHESLDHLDDEKNCSICDQSFNASILNELHLSITNNTFKCCVCEERLDVQDMTKHALEH